VGATTTYVVNGQVLIFDLILHPHQQRTLASQHSACVRVCISCDSTRPITSHTFAALLNLKVTDECPHETQDNLQIALNDFCGERITSRRTVIDVTTHQTN
jgi:hypothetical protein